MSSRQLTVIIPSKTASNLIPCVQAVRKYEPDVPILMIDDGVDWVGSDFARHVPTEGNAISAVIGKKPFIFSRACNMGIYWAGADDVILLNDDALLETPGGFTAMRHAAAFRDYGVLGATTNNVGNLNQHPSGGRGLREDKMVCFVCVLIPRSTINLVGPLDERFTAYGWDDNDYCRRVRQAGLKVGIFDGCHVDHNSLRSTFRGNPSAPASIEAGAAIYRAKWGDLS